MENVHNSVSSKKKNDDDEDDDDRRVNELILKSLKVNNKKNKDEINNNKKVNINNNDVRAVLCIIMKVNHFHLSSFGLFKRLARYFLYEEDPSSKSNYFYNDVNKVINVVTSKGWLYPVRYYFDEPKSIADILEEYSKYIHEVINIIQ